MNRIYKKMQEAKDQYKVGLISLVELNQILKRLDIELMGCDTL